MFMCMNSTSVGWVIRRTSGQKNLAPEIQTLVEGPGPTWE